jgi:hypothetical protein
MRDVVDGVELLSCPPSFSLAGFHFSKEKPGGSGPRRQAETPLALGPWRSGSEMKGGLCASRFSGNAVLGDPGGSRTQNSRLTVRCAKWATVRRGPHNPGESPRRGGGPPLSVGYPSRVPRDGCVGRAEPLPRVLCKGEGLPRERSSAGNGLVIIPRCVVRGWRLVSGVAGGAPRGAAQLIQRAGSLRTGSPNVRGDS